MGHFKSNEAKAAIFHIQRFCLHDGPGIRTTIFFSGCPLTCPWCCNPESATLKPVLMHDENRCVLCGRCVAACPQEAISVSNGAFQVDRSRCTGCGCCHEHCMQEALEISGSYLGMKEVVEEALKDKAFYLKSGGGVTLSGGEVLMQVDFIRRLYDELHREGVSVACETSAFAPSETFRVLLESSDLFLIDLKHYDDKKLREVCHADGRQIRKNIRTVLERGKPLIGRIPVIPGFNDTKEDMKRFAQYAKDLSIRKLHLLPFHQLGELKYGQLDRSYPWKDFDALHKEDVEEAASYLKGLGFTVEIGG